MFTIFYPPDKVLYELAGEQVGLVWGQMYNPKTPLEPDLGIFVKLPTSIIKSIYTGCKFFVLLSEIIFEGKTSLHLSMFVVDIIDAPFYTHDIVSNYLDIKGLRYMLETQSSDIYFINEANHPVARAKASLNKNETSNLLCYLNGQENILKKDLAYTELNRLNIIDKTDGLFRNVVEKYYSKKLTGRKHFYCLNISLGSIKAGNIIHIDDFGVSTFKLNEKKEEGKNQEEVIFNLIGSIYKQQTSHSPCFQKKGKKKELIDVMGWDKNHICLIESKILSIFSSDLTVITPEKSAKRLTKHIEKGKRQIIGAVRNLKNRETKIEDNHGKLIKIPNNSLKNVHGIILFHEMYYFLNWGEIANNLIALRHEKGITVQILDLGELQKIVVRSDSSKIFNDILEKRWLIMEDIEDCLFKLTIL